MLSFMAFLKYCGERMRTDRDKILYVDESVRNEQMFLLEQRNDMTSLKSLIIFLEFVTDVVSHLAPQ